MFDVQQLMSICHIILYANKQVIWTLKITFDVTNYYF